MIPVVPFATGNPTISLRPTEIVWSKDLRHGGMELEVVLRLEGLVATYGDYHLGVLSYLDFLQAFVDLLARKREEPAHLTTMELIGISAYRTVDGVFICGEASNAAGMEDDEYAHQKARDYGEVHWTNFRCRMNEIGNEAIVASFERLLERWRTESKIKWP